MSYFEKHLMPCPSAWTKYFLSRTKSDLSKTNWFCPWQNIFCPGQKFCPWLQTSFLKAKMIFKLWTKFLSWTKNILSLTKLFCLGQIWFCPGQKIFCPGRWTGHKNIFRFWKEINGSSRDQFYSSALSICPDKIFFVPDNIIFVLDKTFLSQTKNFVLS